MGYQRSLCQRSWLGDPTLHHLSKQALPLCLVQGGEPREWLIAVFENGWMANELGVKWLERFDKHTKERSIGGYRLLILDGHRSHSSIQFQEHCTELNTVALYMSTHSFHLLQPN